MRKGGMLSEALAGYLHTLAWLNGRAAGCGPAHRGSTPCASTNYQRDVTAAWRLPTPLVRVRILALVPNFGNARGLLATPGPPAAGNNTRV